MSHTGSARRFRDWAAEKTNHPREVVEAALAHVVRDKVEAAYARSDLFERRRDLMNDWEAYLNGSAARMTRHSAEPAGLNVAATQQPLQLPDRAPAPQWHATLPAAVLIAPRPCGHRRQARRPRARDATRNTRSMTVTDLNGVSGSAYRGMKWVATA